MARGQRDPGLERRWRERMIRWRASGVSIRQFCEQQRLTEASFYYWKRELQARDAAASRSSATARSSRRTAPGTVRTSQAGVSALPPANSPAISSSTNSSSRIKSPPLFVPLTVIPAATVSNATLTVEVRCPSGHVVMLPACELSTLTALFAALESQPREPQPC